MGLKDDYYRNLQIIQQELQLQKQIEIKRKRQQVLNEQDKQRCHYLCEKVPSLRMWYQDPDRWGHGNYRKIYEYTLAVSLTKELQSLIRDFIEICPSSAWISSPRKDAMQKCKLADDSVHIFRVIAPGDDQFRFGSQNYVMLPFNCVKDTGDADYTWLSHELYIFQDGFVHMSDEFWIAHGNPLSGTKELNAFLLRQLTHYARYKCFDRSGTQIPNF